MKFTHLPCVIFAHNFLDVLHAMLHSTYSWHPWYVPVEIIA